MAFQGGFTQFSKKGAIQVAYFGNLSSSSSAAGKVPAGWSVVKRVVYFCDLPSYLLISTGGKELPGGLCLGGWS